MYASLKSSILFFQNWSSINTIFLFLFFFIEKFLSDLRMTRSERKFLNLILFGFDSAEVQFSILYTTLIPPNKKFKIS